MGRLFATMELELPKMSFNTCLPSGHKAKESYNWIVYMSIMSFHNTIFRRCNLLLAIMQQWTWTISVIFMLPQHHTPSPHLEPKSNDTRLDLGEGVCLPRSLFPRPTSRNDCIHIYSSIIVMSCESEDETRENEVCIIPCDLWVSYTATPRAQTCDATIYENMWFSKAWNGMKPVSLERKKTVVTGY